MSKSKFLLQLNKDFEWDAAVSRAFGEGTTLQNVSSFLSVLIIYSPYFLLPVEAFTTEKNYIPPDIAMTHQ